MWSPGDPETRLQMIVLPTLGTSLSLSRSLSLRLQTNTPTSNSLSPGGLAYGAIGVALPLTFGDGSEQMKCLITHGQDFGVGLLVATALAKMVTLGISMNFGFVGGVMFPSMFIGACAGTAAHLVVGDALPLLLSFSCMMVGVPAGMS